MPEYEQNDDHRSRYFARMGSEAAYDRYLQALTGAHPRQLGFPGFPEYPSRPLQIPPRVARWVLRVLAGTEALTNFAERRHACGAIAALIGEAANERPDDVATLRRRVVQRLESLEPEAAESPGPLQHNLGMLADALRLSTLERELLELRAQYWTQAPLHELFERTFEFEWSDESLVRVLSVAFDVEPKRIWWLLDPERPLFSSGLIRLATSVNGPFQSKLAIQSGLSNALQRPAPNLEALLGFAVRPAPAATLDREHYPHFLREIDTLCAFLRFASRERVEGANVLLHGPPVVRCGGGAGGHRQCVQHRTR